jgi:hypothetical protein
MKAISMKPVLGGCGAAVIEPPLRRRLYDGIS